MNNKPTAKESRYLQLVKEHECVICGASGPSEAHHIRQHSQYLCIPLCPDCHRGGFNGIHGQKRIWDVMKMDEMDALNNFLAHIVWR